MLTAILIGAVLGFIIGVAKLQFKEKPMNTAAQKEAKFDNGGNKVKHNAIYDVFIANSHLIGDKLLGILTHLISEEDEHGLLSIVFQPEYPKTEDGENVMARFYPDTRAMIVNLDAHFEAAEEFAAQVNCRMNFWAFLWQQIIRSIYHEIKEAEYFHDADNIYKVDTSNPERESNCEEYARDMIVELAKDIDIEPPALEDFPYLGSRVADKLLEYADVKNPTGPEEIQQWTIVNDLVYFDPGLDNKDAVEIKTLREYFKELSSDEDTRWSAPVKGMKAQVVEEAVPVVEEPAPAVATPQQTSMFETAADVENTATTEDQPELCGQMVEDKPEIIPDPTDDQYPQTDWEIPNFGEDEGCPHNPFDMHDQIIDEVPGYGTTITEESLMALPGKPEFDASLAKVPAPAAEPTPSIQAPKAEIKPVLPVPTTPEGFVNPFGAQAGSTPQPAKQIEPHSLTGEQQKVILQTVITRLFVHIYSKCGFTPGSDSGFTNAAGVTEPVYIGDIPGASDLFHSMDTVEGKTLSEKRITDTIVGRVLPKSGLPGYHLYLNIRGMKAKRSFIPQNPNKMNNGVLSKWAELARAGHMIGMLTQEGKGIRASIKAAPGGQIQYELDPFKK